MSAKKEDPRAIRSKRLLKEAAIALLAETGNTQELTVQKVAARAELNRATFYLHYTDMRDLLRHVVYDVFDDLSESLSPLLETKQAEAADQMPAILDYFYQHRRYLSVLMQEKGFRTKLHQFIAENVQARREFLQREPEQRLSKDIIASSFVGILSWWIQNGSEYSSDFMASQLSLWISKWQ